jgi:hypothetical protein
MLVAWTGVCAALACVAASSNVLPAAEVALMDGRVVQGTVVRWQDDELEVTADGQATSLAAEEILRVGFAPLEDAAPGASLELIDGSVLPIEAFTVKGGQATAAVASGEEPVIIPTAHVATVHLQPPTPAIAAQWDELRGTEEVGDLIVIRKEGAVDHLAGRLGDVSETHVAFYLEEDEYPVERGRVDGLVYFHAQKRELPEPLCTIRGRGGLRLTSASAQLEGERLRVQTTSGVKLSIPFSEIESVDFSAGKLLYLGDLAPLAVRTTPLVAFPESVEIAARLTAPVIDRGFFGGQAVLRYPHYEEDRIAGWELRPHPRSIGLRSKSEVVYDIPDGFRRLQAIAGLDGTLSGRGNVHVAIHGDDRLLWEETIDGGQGPVEIDLDLAGVRRLRVVVDYGAGGDAADRIYLCEARVTK